MFYLTSSFSSSNIYIAKIYSLHLLHSSTDSKLSLLITEKNAEDRDSLNLVGDKTTYTLRGALNRIFEWICEVGGDEETIICSHGGRNSLYPILYYCTLDLATENLERLCSYKFIDSQDVLSCSLIKAIQKKRIAISARNALPENRLTYMQLLFKNNYQKELQMLVDNNPVKLESTSKKIAIPPCIVQRIVIAATSINDLEIRLKAFASSTTHLTKSNAYTVATHLWRRIRGEVEELEN